MIMWFLSGLVSGTVLGMLLTFTWAHFYTKRQERLHTQQQIEELITLLHQYDGSEADEKPKEDPKYFVARPNWNEHLQ